MQMRTMIPASRPDWHNAQRADVLRANRWFPTRKARPWKSSLQLAERIFDFVADAVIYANRSGEIVRWNRACAALFGFSAEEAVGQSLDLIIPEHLRAAHWRGFEAAMSNGRDEASRPPHADPRAAQERGQTLHRDDVRGRQRRRREARCSARWPWRETSPTGSSESARRPARLEALEGAGSRHPKSGCRLLSRSCQALGLGYALVDHPITVDRNPRSLWRHGGFPAVVYMRSRRRRSFSTTASL